MTWPTRTLADCATFMSGGTPNKGNPEYWGGDIPWVSSGEMGAQFISDTSLSLTQAGLLAGSKLVPAGTTFVVVRGMSLATEFRVCYATKPMAFNQDVKAVVAAADIDPYFLFSSLRAHAGQIRDLATEAAHGTKKLEMERLLSHAIGVPDLKTQEDTVAVVRRYDELIENNRRRIALLEESARLLYREWFVHLRFPDAGPLDPTTGLPSGWRRAPLEEALFLQRGFDLPNGSRVPDGVPVYASSGVAGFHNVAMAVGPGVVTGRSGTLGAVHYADEDYWPLNTALWVKEFRAVGPAFAYFLLAEMDLAQLNSGSTVPSLDRKVVHAQPVVIPAAEAVAEFEGRATLLFQQIKVLRQSTAAATEARDALLPKLMSGEIAV